MKKAFNYFKYKVKYKSSIVMYSAYIGKNVILEGKNKINAGTSFFGKLGYGSYIGCNCNLNANIGKYCSISNNVIIIQGRHPSTDFVSTHPAFYSLLRQSGFTYTNRQKYLEFAYADEEKKIPVIIGNDVWIGTDVSIIAGVKIGDGAIILASAVITKDVEPYAIVGGVPAVKIKQRFDDSVVKNLLKFQWWFQPEDWIKKNVDAFESTERLLKCRK